MTALQMYCSNCATINSIGLTWTNNEAQKKADVFHEPKRD